MEREEISNEVQTGIKNALGKEYHFHDNFNFKMNDDFFFKLALSTRNSKDISVVYWFLKSMNKNNMILNTNNKYLYDKAQMSKPSFYKLINRLEENHLVIRLEKKIYMVNPNVVINHRKTLNKDRPELLAAWGYHELRLK